MKYLLITHSLILYYAHELPTVVCYDDFRNIGWMHPISKKPKYTHVATVGDMLHVMSCNVNHGYSQWVAWLDMSVLSFQ